MATANAPNPAHLRLVEDSPASDFGEKLSFALRALNLSRARLAAELKLNKASTTRWTMGRTAPSGDSLERLTHFIALKTPGFSQLSWDLPWAQFQRLFEAAESDEPWQDQVTRPAALLGAQGAVDPSQAYDTYVGVYAVVHAFILPPSALAVNPSVVWRQGSRLMMRTFYPGASFAGQLVFVQQHLFGNLVVEGPEPFVSSGYINPVVGRKAMILDALWMTQVLDGAQTPTCVRSIGIRMGDLPAPNKPVEEAWLERSWDRMAKVMDDKALESILGPRILEVLRPQTVDPSFQGLAKLSASKSANFAISERNITHDLAMDLERITAAFTGDIAAPD